MCAGCSIKYPGLNMKTEKSIPAAEILGRLLIITNFCVIFNDKLLEECLIFIHRSILVIHFIVTVVETVIESLGCFHWDLM